MSDGIVDHFLDVWFDPNGEVYSPLVVQRFVSNPSAGTSDEWMAVRNVSPMSLPLGAGFRLGDEETPDGTEGMFAFPAGATLLPGAWYFVARNGTSYLTSLGELPDAEFPPSTSGSIPDMVAYTVWATGTLVGLVNAGDEILILDPQLTILDVAVYGTGAYFGVQSMTAPGVSQVTSRNSASLDTDNCAVDFSNFGAQCASDAVCGSLCKLCSENACVNRPLGSSCSDGGDSCGAVETQYVLYEGTLAGHYDHERRGACPALEYFSISNFTPLPGDSYYLVVPLSDTAEGSYGTNSLGDQIPRGTGAGDCRATWDSTSCP